MQTNIYITLFIIYGLIIGSFLNVCIYRIPMKISVAKGRSYCPNCHHSLYGSDLVPIFSYLFLGRKCRYCNKKISPRYALVELLSAVLFAVAYLHFNLTLSAILACLLSAVLIVLTFIDIDTREIPDRLHIIILALALINLFGNNFDTRSLIMKIIGFFAVSLFMLLLALLTGGFGGGDIKLMAVTGLYLGVFPSVIAFLIGAFLAALFGIYLSIRKKANRKSQIAFGPFLSIGILISLYFSDNIINAYMSLF